jgi:hypothetical protein
MLDTETNLNIREGFRLLNTTLLMQSEIISVVFEIRIENGTCFKVSNETNKMTKCFYPSSK